MVKVYVGRVISTGLQLKFPESELCDDLTP